MVNRTPANSQSNFSILLVYGLRLCYDMATQSIELDLSTVVSSLSDPKRPHDRVVLSEDFQKCLDNKVNNCHSYYYTLFLFKNFL